jgi:hypothetical protein
VQVTASFVVTMPISSHLLFNYYRRLQCYHVKEASLLSLFLSLSTSFIGQKERESGGGLVRCAVR